MSQGKSNRYALGPLVTLPDAEVRREIARWAGRLPLGMIGCVVTESATIAAPAADWTKLTWSATSYESDLFFPPLASAQSEFTIPAELGGLYCWHLALTIDTASPLFIWRLVHQDGYDASTTILASGLELVTHTLSFVQTFSIPKILSPKDKIYLQFGAFIGASVDFTVAHNSTFFRHVSADLQPIKGVLS